MAQHKNENTNTGYKGHYWTQVMFLNDMRATQEDMERYYESKHLDRALDEVQSAIMMLEEM